MPYSPLRLFLCNFSGGCRIGKQFFMRRLQLCHLLLKLLQALSAQVSARGGFSGQRINPLAVLNNLIMQVRTG